MRRLIELLSAINYLFFGQFVIDYDCNRAKINEAMKKLLAEEKMKA